MDAERHAGHIPDLVAQQISDVDETQRNDAGGTLRHTPASGFVTAQAVEKTQLSPETWGDGILGEGEEAAGSAAARAHTVARRYGTRDVKVHDGHINYTLVADKRFVIKIPQQDDEFRLQSLARERAALTLLENADLSPIAVPQLIEFSSDPPFLVASYVPGRASVPKGELLALSAKKREALGREMGAYIVCQAAAINPQAVRESIPVSSRQEWARTFKAYIESFSDPNYPNLSLLTSNLGERWRACQADIVNTGLHFIHGDLTFDNIGLSDTYGLLSVFDFARAGLGTIPEALSSFALIDDALLQGCLKELEIGGYAAVDVEHIRLWRHLKDLYVLPFWIKQGDTSNPFYAKCREIIVRRYPGFYWSELY
jgi:hypothetical protein